MPRFHVSRSTVIEASPEEVFDKVANYESWTSWSPWLCADKDAQVSVSPDPSSVGSAYAWQGDVVGQGEIEHHRLNRGRLIEDELRFIKPFKSRSDVGFDFEPEATGTKVTWNMHGSMPWFLFWMLPQMQTYIGMDYERGLRMLKESIETGTVLSKTDIRGVESAGPLRMAGVPKQCQFRDVGSSMESSFAEVTEVFNQHGLPTVSDPMSVYHHVDLKGQTFDYTSGWTIPATIDQIPAEFNSWSLPASQALVLEHVGSYQNLGNAWSAAYQYARYKKLKMSRLGTFEIYRKDPSSTPPAELMTEIVLPIR